MTHPTEPGKNRSGQPSHAVDNLVETLSLGKDIGNEEIPLPDKIGRFDVESILGSGAFGIVLLASDESLSRKVAIKIPRGSHTEKEIDGFLVEARQLAQLQHSGIVAVHDIGREGNLCYIVTEYLDGVTLAKRMQEQQFGFREAIGIVIQLAEAIAHAHSRGVMHRDIKPGNVILTTDGRCVLLDFGLAVNDLNGVRGEIAGTPTYMAPEQVRGESHCVDGRTDIYALGTILYEMLTGRPPFRATKSSELFRRILEDSPQPVRQLNTAIPSGLDEICFKALEKNISDRFTTAGDFAAALKAALGENSEDKHWDSDLRSDPVGDLLQFQSTLSKSSAVESSVSHHLREAELRTITLLSVGFDPAGLSAEDQHAMAEQFGSELKKVASEFGGNVLVASGHMMSFCFGFPVAFEDSAARAVRCGLRILELGQKNNDLPDCDRIFQAIHLGESVAEETPLGVKVTGDVMNELSRLMAIIDENSVVITKSVQKSCRLVFETEDLGELPVRGLAKPMHLYRVIRESAVTSNRVELVDPENLTPLVGRDTELGILKDRWEQAVEAMGQMVLLIGEAGLGKSRLIREIREFVASEEEEPDIIELRCSQYHQSAGLYPVVEHLTQWLKFDEHPTSDSKLLVMERHLEALQLRTDRNIALLAALMNVESEALPSLNVSPQRKRELMSEFLLEMLRRRSETRPVLFIVEDLHWVDPSLLELLSMYVEEFEQSRVLSIFTFRPEFETPWKSKQHQTQIALNRLTRRQVRMMMEKRLRDEQVSDEIVEQIVERTDGIPLFIEEFTNLLAETRFQGNFESSESTLSQVIPTSLQDLLLAKLDRMDSNREVIQLASAIGREFSFSLIQAASDLPGNLLEEELAKLRRAEVLFQKGRFPDANFIFKHALIQDSAYNSLLTKRRQVFHSQIADALENKLGDIAAQQPDLVAHHFTRAGNAEKGVEYWLKAGQRSQEQSANVEAIKQFEQGLELLYTLPSSPNRDAQELAFKLPLSAVLMAVQGYAAPEVEPLHNRCIEICRQLGEGSPLFPVLISNWVWLFVRCRFSDCYQRCDEVISMAETAGGPGMMSEAQWTQICTSMYTGDFNETRKHGEIGWQSFDREASIKFSKFTQQNSGPLNLSQLGLALWQNGYADRGIADVFRALELSYDLNHPFTQTVIEWMAGQVFEFSRIGDKAVEHGKKCYQIADEQAFAFWKGMGLSCQGVGLKHLGRYDESTETLRAGISQMAVTGALICRPKYKGHLADSLWHSGRRKEAVQMLEEAFENQNTGEYFSHCELLHFRGDFALDRGDYDEAESSYQESLSIAASQGSKMYELRATLRRCRIWEMRQQWSEVKIHLGKLFNEFTEGFDLPDLKLAKQILERLD